MTENPRILSGSSMSTRRRLVEKTATASAAPAHGMNVFGKLSPTAHPSAAHTANVITAAARRDRKGFLIVLPAMSSVYADGAYSYALVVSQKYNDPLPPFSQLCTWFNRSTSAFASSNVG